MTIATTKHQMILQMLLWYRSDVVIVTTSEQMKPTIGISITDIGGTSFQSVDEKKEFSPSLTEPSLNLGFSFKPLQKKINI